MEVCISHHFYPSTRERMCTKECTDVEQQMKPVPSLVAIFDYKQVGGRTLLFVDSFVCGTWKRLTEVPTKQDRVKFRYNQSEQQFVLSVLPAFSPTFYCSDMTVNRQWSASDIHWNKKRIINHILCFFIECSGITVLFSSFVLVFLVLRRSFHIRVENTDAYLGNSALLKCHIPEYVRNYVIVSNWFREEEVLLPDVNDVGEYSLICGWMIGLWKLSIIGFTVLRRENPSISDHRVTFKFNKKVSEANLSGSPNLSKNVRTFQISEKIFFLTQN